MSAIHARPRESEAGFSLVETVIAMGILATGLLSMAGVFVMGMGHLAASSANLIAREKAREAIESVHTARDTRAIAWTQIRNVADDGVFVDGALPLRQAGVDGIVNTADDADADMEKSLEPGPDNILGTEDDQEIPLTGYTRQIIITELLTNGVASQTLRQLQVIVTFSVGAGQRTYTLTTYISQIS